MIPEADFVNMILSAEACPSFQAMIFQETGEGMMVGFKPHSTSELSSGSVTFGENGEVKASQINTINIISAGNENKSDVIRDVSDVMHDGFNHNGVRTYAQVTLHFSSF